MWYNSAMNYDMITAGPWNNMNLHMNQMMDHSIAWNNMFSVPSYNFGNFMPYGNMGFNNNAFLTNPMYTLGQMSWGTPMWNSNMWGGNMWNCWGWNGATTNGSGGNDSDTGATRKYNRLLSLVKQLEKYDQLTETEKDILKTAIKNTKGTTEEKYERLLEAYNQIDKALVRDFLSENADKLGVKSDVNGKEDSDDTFTNRLLGTGHKIDGLTDKGASEFVAPFYDGIKSLSNSNGTHEACSGLATSLGTSVDVLDFVSSWNSTYKGDKDASRVIDHIAKYYNKISDPDQRSSAKSSILSPLVNGLIDKANKVKRSLDSDSKEAMESAIDDVREALNDTDKRVDSDLSDAFDELYLLTRRAALLQLQNDAKSYYGDIDDDVFNASLFKQDMIDDLKEEGFTDSEISAANVTLSARSNRSSKGSGDNGGDSGSGSSNKIAKLDDKAGVYQIEGLAKEGILMKTNVSYNGGTIYTEIDGKKSGDSDGDGKADYARLFYINPQGEFVELQGRKLNGNTLETISGKTTGEIQVKASTVANYKKDIEKKAEEKGKKSSSGDKDEDFYYYGSQTYKLLDGYTDDSSDNMIKNLYLANLDEDNILDFLKGYYSNGSDARTGNCREGLIEGLNDDAQAYSSDLYPIIEAVLEKAASMDGVKDSSQYKNLSNLLKEHKATGANDFDNAYSGKFWAWTGCNTDYKEKFDEYLEALYDKMIAEEKE